MVALIVQGHIQGHIESAVVSGIPVRETPQIDSLLLLDQMRKLLTDANGLGALQKLSGFSPDERKTLVDYINYFRRPPAKGKGKSRKKTKPRKK